MTAPVPKNGDNDVDDDEDDEANLARIPMPFSSDTGVMDAEVEGGDTASCLIFLLGTGLSPFREVSRLVNKFPVPLTTDVGFSFFFRLLGEPKRKKPYQV